MNLNTTPHGLAGGMPKAIGSRVPRQITTSIPASAGFPAPAPTNQNEVGKKRILRARRQRPKPLEQRRKARGHGKVRDPLDRPAHRDSAAALDLIASEHLSQHHPPRAPGHRRKTRGVGGHERDMGLRAAQLRAPSGLQRRTEPKPPWSSRGDRHAGGSEEQQRTPSPSVDRRSRWRPASSQC